jgi:signal transduction histidine kinase
MAIAFGDSGLTTSAGGAVAPPRSVRVATRAFRRLDGAAVVWLGVRQARSPAAVVGCSDGAACAPAIGVVIRHGEGIGGAVLANGVAWRGDSTGDAVIRASDDELSFLLAERMSQLMVVPLTTTGFSGEARIEGVAYVGRHDGVPWSDEAMDAARQLGRRVGRTVRDAQRVAQATQDWKRLWAELVAMPTTADRRLEQLAYRIAADARSALRGGLAIVFRLDTTSGALHSLGVDGEMNPGKRTSAVDRGQVMPPGSGGAGRAVALRTTFIARDYAAAVTVPPIMEDDVAGAPTLTTLSTPLTVGDDVFGALTVGRFRVSPAADFSRHDVRVATRLMKVAAPLLARAQAEAERQSRQQGAATLSRLAGSLTQSLPVSAVCEQLVRSVLALVSGLSASIWNPHGEPLIAESRRGILGEPKDPRLRQIVDHVMRSQRAFWTPDLANDSRLAAVPAGAGLAHGGEGRAVLVAPVRIREMLLGVLGVASNTGRAFTEADVELVQALADQAALGIANARAYHELQVSNIRLLRHEKLVAVGRLTSGLAHELRNPLQNVVGLTSEILDRLPAETPQALSAGDITEYVRRAYTEAKRAADIVDRLLDYVRECPRTLETVDMRAVIDDAVGLVTATAGAGKAKISVSSDDDGPLLVYGDGIMLRQVVLNLVNNALDAIDGAGEVEVHTRLERTPIGPGRVMVSVRDTGRGIPPQHLPHVFDLFFTTKETGHGVGLGLAVCQSLIEQHGGTIRVTSSDIGRGTTFEFELPVKT